MVWQCRYSYNNYSLYISHDATFQTSKHLHISVSDTNGCNKQPGMAQFSVDNQLANWEKAEDDVFTGTWSHYWTRDGLFCQRMEIRGKPANARQKHHLPPGEVFFFFRTPDDANDDVWSAITHFYNSYHCKSSISLSGALIHHFSAWSSVLCMADRLELFGLFVFCWWWWNDCLKLL